ncbi:flagellin, partial [Agathobacter rectalis]
IDQLTTEIDRVSETTKFNETYLLKGDGAEKAHNVNAHDAGIDGVTLTDKGDKVDVTLKELKAGDKISIAGKNYTIGATVDQAKKLYDGIAKGNKITVNGTTYELADATDAAKGQISQTDLDGKIKGGTTVEYGNKKAYVINDTATTGIDDNDSSVVTAAKAYELETAEIVKASSIGTDTAATTTAGATADKFTLTKGKVNYNDALSFNLHVGADADMTNKITVNIDSMNSAGLGVKGIKADTEQDATYAIDAIADAISTVSSQRSALGAVQNRLEHTINNLDNVVENTTSAESRIRDTDMA